MAVQAVNILPVCVFKMLVFATSKKKGLDSWSNFSASAREMGFTLEKTVGLY